MMFLKEIQCLTNKDDFSDTLLTADLCVKMKDGGCFNLRVKYCICFLIAVKRTL